MSERKNIVILTGIVLSVSLIAVSLTAFFLNNYYCGIHMRVLGEISQKIMEDMPEAETAVLSALKEYVFNIDKQKTDKRKSDKMKTEILESENFLLAYGYNRTHFYQPMGAYVRLFAIAGCLIGGLLFVFAFLFLHKRDAVRIKQLTDYLEKINTGCGGELFWNGEDDFSRLQDEIYKTVTQLYQTRDAALRAKNNFAENLYNIAHQMKTPITAMSLSVQMMKDNPSGKHLEQINQQISRLTHLEEALLLLSRIDAGTLSMERQKVDVFTVLMLAADNLQSLFEEAGVSVSIPESEEAVIYADLDWTMEAIMNLLKNSMEHTPSGGTVYCSYEQNLLYTQIQIWDTGCGFEKEDIPHLFERFYRGVNTKNSGIGIGLALSKAIIECQNGTITARNLAGKGACFDIHFYRTNV